jgi:WXG100 family type VII secretion target
VPQPIRVDPQQLAEAAARIRSSAEQLQAGHGSAIAAADAAQPGLVGQSARSISAKTRRWQATTAELHRVLASQAAAIANAAQGYANTEDNNQAVIAAVGDDANL